MKKTNVGISGDSNQVQIDTNQSSQISGFDRSPTVRRRSLALLGAIYAALSVIFAIVVTALKFPKSISEHPGRVWILASVIGLALIVSSVLVLLNGSGRSD
jgi:threonine/homoserine/homoserine lactone efflux protein